MVNKITIDLKAIASNIAVIKSRLKKGVDFIAVVKANAYGHGIVEISKCALKSGADSLAVFSPEEGLKLRHAGVKSPILILGYTDQANYRQAIENQMTISVVEYDQVYEISKEAYKIKQKALLDIKVDTGMNRFGFSPMEAMQKYDDIIKLPNIKIVGMHSHLADASDKVFSRGQIRKLSSVIEYIKKNRLKLPKVHLLATEGTFRYPEAQFDAVRIGIGMYGIYDFETRENELLPALTFKTKIAQIKYLQVGDSVSYKRTLIAKKSMTIAVLPIGYADGVPRALSNLGQVLINGNRATIVGRICMNALMADITGIDCQEGDEVVLIGQSGSDKISASDIARLIDTNPHEILTGLSKDLPREYIGG